MDNTLSALIVISDKFPIGVAIIYNPGSISFLYKRS